MTTDPNTTELSSEEVASLVADAPAPNPGEAFCPTDAAGVDWVLAKMNAARAEAALIRQNAELMARECERRAEFLEWKYGANLQAFARQQLDGGKKKSVRLYHGVVGFRTKPATVLVTNFAAALGWAKDNLPGAVTEALDRKTLAGALLRAEELPGFAEAVPAEDVFYIK